MIRHPGGIRSHRPAADRGRWLVALPVWGERYVEVFMRHTLPALLIALRGLSRPVVLYIWTDQQQRIAQALWPDLQVIYADPPGPDRSFESMSNCHRHVLAAAAPGERTLLLTADMVLSCEVLATAEAQLAAGKRLVACAAMRALEDADAPIGASGAELLSWAWDNRHRMTRECTWPEGRSYDVWRMYFEHEGEVAARVFLPHPLVCVPAGRRVHFRPTIDVNLINHFAQSETHMITRPEEGAVVELSPPDKEFLETDTMAVRMGTRGPSCPPFIRCVNHRHRMFFEKKVVIRGTGGDCGDTGVVRRILG